MAIQDFVTGQVLTSTQMDNLQANDYNQTVSAKVASYVLVAADKGTRVTMSNAGATTITVNTALFAAGDTLFITNIGAGACTITAGTATVSTASSLVLAQYDSGRLYFTSTGVAIWEKYQGASAASSSGLVFIKSASFSSVATTTTTFDNIFSSTYKFYRLDIQVTDPSTSTLLMQFRAGGATQSSSAYYTEFFGYANAAATPFYNNPGVDSKATLTGLDGASKCSISMNVSDVGATGYPKYQFTAFDASRNGSGAGGGLYNLSITADGVIFSASAGNITGVVSVYGLANA